MRFRSRDSACNRPLAERPPLALSNGAHALTTWQWELLCVQRLAAANAAGMNIMRFFNGGEGSEVAALVTSPGAAALPDA